MKAVLAIAGDHPRFTAIIGSVFGWVSFDALRAAQVFAAILAGMVSLCALILTAPKAIAEVKRWFS